MALYIVMIFLTFYCKKDTSEETTIRYMNLSDESMRFSKGELEDKIRSLDSEILEIMNQINSIKRDINRERENLKKDTIKTNITLENLKEERQRTISDSLRIEKDILDKARELQNFLFHNEFQIEIGQLQRRKDEVDRFLYDLNHMINSKNRINKLIIQTRLRIFQEDFERLKISEIKFPQNEIIEATDKSILESIKKNLNLVTTNLDSLINIQRQNFNKIREQKNNELNNLNESLQKTIAAIENYNRRITQNEMNVTITCQNSLNKITKYQNSNDIFDTRRYKKTDFVGNLIVKF